MDGVSSAMKIDGATAASKAFDAQTPQRANGVQIKLANET
jgi:hypothetical protein